MEMNSKIKNNSFRKSKAISKSELPDLMLQTYTLINQLKNAQAK